MKVKRLLCIALLLAAFPILAACKKEEAPVTTNSPITPTPTTSVTLTIAGNDLSSYTIVYAENPYGNRIARGFTTEYDFYRLIATDLMQRIYAQTGVQLPVKEDADLQESEFEILVGPTNRAESDGLDTMDVYETYCKVVGTKLIVGGGYDSTEYTGNLKKSYCYAATNHAWDAVESYLTDAMTQGVSTVDFPDGCDFSTTVDLITVACVGDSITEGYASTDWELHSYPAVLGRILWQDHLIINLGNSGRTMRDDLANRYIGTAQHTAMRRNAKLYDYALIMLGTNDSYFDRTWPAASDEKYLTSADTLVEHITSKNSDVQVVIMNCPVYYGNEGSGSPHVRALQNQLPARLEENGVNSSFFDMHAYTAENVGSANFPDLLHPNDKGYAIMAEGVAELLQKLRDGTYTYTLPEIEGDIGNTPAPKVPIAEGAVNILGKDLSEVYPITGNGYTGWFMGGTPYVYMDLDVFEGYTVTNLEIPVSSVRKGNKFTVSVVKYSHPTVTETLKSYTITADFNAGAGYAGFGGLNIEVPEGYTLAFGAPSDTLPLLYVTSPTAGYSFYGSGGNSINTNATLAFNIYGK